MSNRIAPLSFTAALVAAVFAAPLAAQPAPSSTPVPAPAAAPPAAEPPAWMQGQAPEYANPKLHPFAPIVTGRMAADLPLNTLKVPPGFKVEVWADGIPMARSLAVGDKGTVFVGSRVSKNVMAVVTRDGKREVKTLLSGLTSPNGVAFHKGSLYVAEPERILRYDAIESRLDNPPEPRVLVSGLPKQGNHFWKTLAVGPDGKLYFNVGAPFNIGMPNYLQASILRVDPDSGIVEDVALGVRNSVGMAFHPTSKQLWFTDNARDWLGENGPEDELNVVTKRGEHFGFPYCHQGDIPDPEFGKGRSCAQFTPPAAKLGAHTAPLGMTFYTGSAFPADYRHNAFIAEHGSWNRSVKQGYNVTRAVIGPNGKVTKVEPFLTGFLQDDKADPPMWGRPVDVAGLADGSLLVSDDYNGVIYRVSYAKK